MNAEVVGMIVALLGGAAALFFGKKHVEKKAADKVRNEQTIEANRVEAKLAAGDARIDANTDREIKRTEDERTEASRQLEERLSREPTFEEVNDLIARSKE